MAPLFFLLAILLGVGFVWLLSATARTQPPSWVEGQTIAFRHGRLLRAFALFAFFGVGFLLALWGILYPPKGNQTYLPLVVTAIVLAVAGFLLGWEAFRFQLTTTPTELNCDSPWSGRATRSWSQVSVLEYSRANLWFVLRFQDGGSFRISAFVPGVVKFLELCEQQLKPEQMARAASGYARLGRKWPY